MIALNDDFKFAFIMLWSDFLIFGFQYIGQLAAFCEQVYQSSSPNDRRQAENVLNEFMNSSDALEKCIHVLKRLGTCFALCHMIS